MQYFNNILCFEAGWLVDNEICTFSIYKHAIERKQIQVVRRASRGTPALVAYDSLPDRFKAAIVEKMGGDPYKMAKQNILEGLIEHNTEASVFFEGYKLSDGRYLPIKTRREYYANAIVLDAIGVFIATQVVPRKAKGQKTGGAWKYISEAVQSLDRTQYPHTLPENSESLQRKYDKYKAESYTGLIHANFLKGIRNAASINDKVKESLVIELLADPRNLDNEQVARLYNQIAEPMGWRKITGATVANWRDRYEMEIYAGRRGSVAFSNKKAMQVKRSAPTSPLFYWTLDGWDVELLYQKHNGKTITYHNRPTVVVVLDPCCKYPIGYAVGTHETPELIKAALRNAAQHTARLFGSMYRAHQIQSDRYAYNTLEPLYAAMGKHVTPARAKNAKAKVIEPYFGYINKTYCQTQPNWSGFGITSGKDKQPNSEFLNKYKTHFPDFAGVCEQVELVIEMERQKKRDEYLELWSKTAEADKIPLSYESYLYHFGESTGYKNMLQGDGMNVTIRGIKQHFDCFDLNFRKHASVQWAVLFDPDDTTRILAINDDGTLRFILEKKHVQPMALKDRQAGDGEALSRVNQFNCEMVEYVTDFRADTGETVRDFLQERERQLSGTLARLMLTDSRGQHKDNRNIDAGRKPKVSPTEIINKKTEKQKVETIYDLM
ncbi:hypothetical protein D0T49_00235 [Paludibacter sp. 221]|uniref:hypothetical protein n=1 Tax=Paludibacter sp. 221 TaxID=2302939 RepID=UPI0013D8B29D|nr:hypothetical protein [Paludibacter sp. 221]NDV45480.1 hypothetical protein [Paludibacter sp. 221]